MKNKFKPLEFQDVKVLKIILVQDNISWNPFSGYLYYTRSLTSDYNALTNDFIDTAIVEAILKVFPNSRSIVSRNIVYEGLLEDILENYAGFEDKEFKITFITDIPYDQILHIHQLKICNPTLLFNFRRISFNEPKKLEIINTHIQADIAFDQAEEFCENIKSIHKKS